MGAVKAPTINRGKSAVRSQPALIELAEMLVLGCRVRW